MKMEKKANAPETITTRQKAKGLFVFFASSFIFHLIWENLHAPLYGPYTDFINFFPRLLYATSTGDMIFMLIIFLTIGIVHKNFWWILDKEAFKRPATWITAIVIGILISVSFELWAVYVDFRWAYKEIMPMIPIVQVGLTPVLQMIIIPMLVIFTTKKIK